MVYGLKGMPGYAGNRQFVAKAVPEGGGLTANGGLHGLIAEELSVLEKGSREELLMLFRAYNLLGFERVLRRGRGLITYELDPESVGKYECPFLSTIILDYDPINQKVTLSELSSGARPKLWEEAMAVLTPSELFRMARGWRVVPETMVEQQLLAKKSL